MVSLTGMAQIAAPWSVAAATTASNRAAVANGRAASCTTITSASSGTAASPQRTEADRLAPPGTTRSAPHSLCVPGPGGHHEDHAGGRRSAGLHGPLGHGPAGQQGELLQLAEALTRTSGHHDRPHVRRHAVVSPALR